MKHFLFLFLFIKIFGQNNEINQINSLVLNEFSDAKTIVVKDSTSIGIRELSDYIFQNFLAYFSNLKEETFNDFQIQNATKTSIKTENFSSSKQIVIIKQTDFKRIFNSRQNGWKRFYKKFPNSQGILTISNIGFNKDRTQALIYYGNQSDYLAGAGFIAFFEKVNGQWKMFGHKELWIS